MLEVISAEEPLIVGYGRQHISSYFVKEFRDSLVRAFKEKSYPDISLDSNMHGQKFLAASVAWGIDEELLCHSEDRPDDPDSPQSITSIFCLTEKGKKQILGPV